MHGAISLRRILNSYVSGGVDYKGCRDFLRAILERAQQIPAVENIAVIDQLDILGEVSRSLLYNF